MRLVASATLVLWCGAACAAVDCSAIPEDNRAKCLELNDLGEKVDALTAKVLAVKRSVDALKATKLSVTPIQFVAEKPLHLKIWLANDGVEPIKDISIVCQQIGPSGTAISGYRQIVYERIEPTKTTIVNDLVFGWTDKQAVSLSCMVESVRLP
jgi:hypothetical protein